MGPAPTGALPPEVSTLRRPAAEPVVRTQGTGTGSALRLRGLRRSFGGVLALDGLDLEAGPGELLSLLGPSGCGKTTALRIVAGLQAADEGCVFVDGKDIASVPAHKRDMGMVFQSYSLFPNLPAIDNVAFGLRLRGIGARGRRVRATELLDLMDLAPHAAKYPHELSGGQQQRVALARALAVAPKVLLLDEPLSALDAVVRVQLREEIRGLQTRLGITTLFVTHDQEEALSISDRVAVLNAGKLEQCATPAEIYTRPATPFVAAFVGSMNRVPGELRHGVIEVVGGRLAVVPGADNPVTGSAIALVRPETVHLAVDEAGPATVVRSSFRGPVTRVTALLTDGTELHADLPSGLAEQFQPGRRVQPLYGPDPVMVLPSP
jgi:putative spermidine/putrescine transport system ATP-binding protein